MEPFGAIWSYLKLFGAILSYLELFRPFPTFTTFSTFPTFPTFQVWSAQGLSKSISHLGVRDIKSAPSFRPPGPPIGPPSIKESLGVVCWGVGLLHNIIGGGKQNKASVIEQIPMGGYIISIFAQILGSLR